MNVMKTMKKNTSRKFDALGEQYFGLLSKVMDLSPALQMSYILTETFFKSENQTQALARKRIIKTLQNFMAKLEQNPSMSQEELRFLVQIQLNNRQVQKIKLLKSVFQFFDKVILKVEQLGVQTGNQESSVSERIALNN